MSRNVEIKARTGDLQVLSALVANLATDGPFELHQDDTFFRCDSGRLKLRDFGDGTGELIFYRRADAPGPRESSYIRSPTSSPGELRESLTLAYATAGRVVKERTLFRVGRTRVHLDRVAGLGEFVELEVVLREGEDVGSGQAEAVELMRRLCITPESLERRAYVDLSVEAGVVTLRPMVEGDLPMLHEWLCRPHLLAWWGEGGRRPTLDETRGRYLPRVLAEERITPFIAMLDDRPIGYAQSYVAMGCGGGWWEEETDPGVRGIDQCLADPELLGRGLGTQLVCALVDLLVRDPAVTRIQTDPAPDDPRAIRCYEKAGFRRIGTVATPGGPAVYMTRTRTPASRRHAFADRPTPSEAAMLQDFPMHAYIPAKELARARAFYEGKLGFKAKMETAGGVVYECGGKSACFLYPTPYAGTSQASQAFWQVDDIEREVAALKARGVVFETYDMPGMDADNILTGGGARAAWFKDSEGNIMAIVQDV